MIHRNLLVSFILFTLFMGTINGQVPAMHPGGSPTRVYYSVFVQSFYDSNGDGIGDIPGLISRLDYLEDLGIQGLWLLPVHPAPTYHKYDITDYYSIHPDYGSLNDYRNLVAEAHKRGMVILLDLVVNHTSNRHPWFVKASRSERNPYRNYYLWSDKSSVFEADPFHWHQVRDGKGKLLEGPRYYGFFWWEMPDLNFDNQEVRQEVIRIAEFWLKEVGVDGFRLDAARYIYGENFPERNLEWWNQFGQAVRKIKPETIVVGEVWGSTDVTAPYLSNGLTACFNFQLSDSIRQSIRDEQDHHILHTWISMHEAFRKQNPRYQDAIFLTNHDMERIMTEVGNNAEKARIAATLLLTLPGNPFIYYGEEIGMLGEKPDEFIREPFLWNVNGEDPGQTNWEIPYASKPGTVKPLFYQKDDPHSIYNYYRSLIRTRNSSPALRSGMLQPAMTGNRKVLAFTRYTMGESVLVLVNLGNETTSIGNPFGDREYRLLHGTHQVFKSGRDRITLQPYSAFIIKTNHPVEQNY